MSRPTADALIAQARQASWHDHGTRYPYARRLGPLLANLAGVGLFEAGCVFAAEFWEPGGSSFTAKAIACRTVNGVRRWYSADLHKWTERRTA